ncbi:hypothetical protein AMTRI_Chr09g19020 [Amborella trichopoda]
MVSRSLEVVNNYKILVENLGFLGFCYQRHFRSLAHVDEEASPMVRGGGWESEEDIREEEKLKEERFGARVEEIDLTTASCSFSQEKGNYLSKKKVQVQKKTMFWCGLHRYTKKSHFKLFYEKYTIF